MPPVSGFPGTGGLIAYLFSVRLELADVYCTELLAVLRILLGIERNLLTLFQSLEALAYDCREMYEYVISAVVVGNKAVSNQKQPAFEAWCLKQLQQEEAENKQKEQSRGRIIV